MSKGVKASKYHSLGINDFNFTDIYNY